EAAWGILLQPDHRRLGGADCGLDRGGPSGNRRRHHLASCRKSHGSTTGMMKELHFSWQSLVAILAWLAALFTLPLSDVATSEATTAVLVVLAAAIGVSLLKPGPASQWGI